MQSQGQQKWLCSCMRELLRLQTPTVQGPDHTQRHTLWGPRTGFGQLLPAHQLCFESRSFKALFLIGDRV